MTAVVVVNWNSGKFLRTCVDSLFAANPGVEVAVIDNASSDGSLETLDDLRDRIHVVRNSSNRGFAAAVNQGFASTTSPYVLVLNPDVRVLPHAVARLEAALTDDPEIAAAGGYVNDKYLPRPLPTPGSLALENLGLATPALRATLPWRGENRKLPVRAGPGIASQEFHLRLKGGGAKRRVGLTVDQPAAAALMIRRDAHEAIGGFDERFVPAWYEDVDFCKRLKEAGWEICFDPEARFEHSGGYSAEALGTKAFAEAYYRNQLRYAIKHFGARGRFAVRMSMVFGMLLRMVSRPGQAAAYASVVRGALGGW